MVLVLDPVPSFGQQLARNIGAGISQGAERSREFAQQLALQKAKQKELMSLFGLSPEKPSSKAKELMGEERQESRPKLSAEQKAALALMNPNALRAYELMEQKETEKEQKVQEKERLESTIQDMSDILERGNLGYTASRFVTPKGRGDAQAFNSASLQLESIAKDMISKGVVSKERFKYALDNLPSANKTDAENAAALQTWAKALDLPVPESLYEKWAPPSKKEKKTSAKTEMKKPEKKGKELDLETMKKLYAKTKGDKEKMKEVARKMGYEIE